MSMFSIDFGPNLRGLIVVAMGVSAVISLRPPRQEDGSGEVPGFAPSHINVAPQYSLNERCLIGGKVNDLEAVRKK